MFAFLLIAQQFSIGIWSALFSAPLPVLLEKSDPSQRIEVLRCLFSTNLVLIGLAALAFTLLSLGLGATGWTAAAFAVCSGAALLRVVARAHAYSTGAPMRTVRSDLVYSAAVGCGVLILILLNPPAVGFFFLVLGVSALVALMPFGSQYFLLQFFRFGTGDVAAYSLVWRQHSGWSLTGVITTELTVNSHAYLVTLLAGPAAFAPVAASALLTRPLGVAMNAMTEFERPRMARQIGENRIRDVLRSASGFRWTLIVIWIMTAISVPAVALIAPGILFAPQYDANVLAAGLALWMAVTAVRLMRLPESVLLQAAGCFRGLAMASILSACISVVAVALLILVGGPVWSIAGILIGEAACGFGIWRQARRWRSTIGGGVSQ
ncbi:hypothetical protein ACLF3G_28890 [Falsiroseomonas sp. HC035]|uniref:hypothetical protein n=1 Tax=Falsiroseomonas sp. HC035 TaxID=3390999 RepID=UPI003D3224AA